MAERCTTCGLCAETCPVEAVTLSPYPEFGPNCIHCYNCVRLCPEQAIAADLSQVHQRIRARAVQMGENPLSQIFF
jgi:formate hydrogenlyase subunit 6/NADH:ubiquinone oxidoreductase subunit I